MNEYVITIVIFGGIWAILTLSLNLLAGEAGLVSLGQAAFFAFGAYTTAYLGMEHQVSFVPALLISAAVGCVLTGALGLLALRVRDDLLVFTTIGVNFLTVALLASTDELGGDSGLVAIPFPEIGGQILDPNAYALVVAGILAVCCAVAWLLRGTWLGLGWNAVRDDETAARMLGVPSRVLKVLAFAVSGALAGLAGGLYAAYLGSVFPQNFDFLLSVQVMAMLVLGGLGTIRGAVIGALVLTAIPELLRPMADYRYTMYGAVLVLIVMFFPGGIVGVVDQLWSRFMQGRRNPTDSGGDRQMTKAAS